MRYAPLASTLLVSLLFSPACGRGQATAVQAQGKAAPSPHEAQAGTEPAAVYEGGSVSQAEVDQRAAGAIARIEQEIYEARRSALDRIITDRLLAKEAAGRKMTVEAFLKAEVDDKIPAPTPEQINAFYLQVAPQVAGRPKQEVLPIIERSLRERSQTEKKAALVEALRQKAGVRIQLKAPRVDVPLPRDAAAIGPPNAPVTIVAYLDYQCPYCRRAQTVVDEVLTRYQGKVRFVPQDFPLEGHPQAFPAARAVRCAGEEGKSWEYHKAIFESPAGLSEEGLRSRAKSVGLSVDSFAACLGSGRHDAEIRASLEAADRLGVSSTPTFFINGRRLVGARDINAFTQVIDEELAAR